MASRRDPDRPTDLRNADLLDRLLCEDGGRLRRQARLHSELRQDAEDALGDACVQFLRRFEGEGLEDARRWMLVVVKRCAWGIARRRRRRRAVAAELSAERLPDELGAVADGGRGPAETVELREETANLLDALHPDERRVLLLLAVGYTLSEVATIAGWTYTKVKRCTYEGRRRLRLLSEGRGEES